jgi:tetratricopeptide (TPR) repeat protein
MMELNDELYNKGLFYLENENPLKALECFKKIEPLYSEDPILLNEIGTTYGHLGNDNQAALYFEKAISINKTLGIAYYNLGIIFLEQENFNKAIEYFGNAIDNKCKDIWNCYYMRANVYYTYTATRQKALSLQAVTDIEKAIELCPFDDADIYLIAGIIFKIIENFDKSKFYLNKAAALGDKDAIRVLSTLK